MSSVTSEEENFGSANGSANTSFIDNPSSQARLQTRPNSPVVAPTDEVLVSARRALQAVRMTNYDETTGEDADSALEKACHMLKGYTFKQDDLEKLSVVAKFVKHVT